MDFILPTGDKDFKNRPKNKSDKLTIKNTGIFEIDYKCYAEKYLTVGLVLYDYAQKEKSISILDSFIFPIAFTLRHSLELKLKSIIFKNETNIKNLNMFIKEDGHDLNKLLLRVLSLSSLDISSDNIVWLSTLFHEISKNDAISDIFRYSTNSSGNQTFNRQTFIDLRELVAQRYDAFILLDKLFYGKDLSNIFYYSKKVPQMLPLGGNYYSQSVIGWSSIEYLQSRYLDGYKGAAEHLQNLIEDTEDLNKKECLFIPLCYLYRHLIELRLKYILYLQSLLRTFDFQILYNTNKHNLEKLWQNIYKIDSNLFLTNSSKNKEMYTFVSNYITSIQKFDTASDLFRYPTGKGLNKYFTRNGRSFSIFSMKMHFTELDNYLTGLAYLYQNELESIDYN